MDTLSPKTTELTQGTISAAEARKQDLAKGELMWYYSALYFHYCYKPNIFFCTLSCAKHYF